MATEIPIRPSDTIVLDVEYTNRTQVKTVVVGTPIRSIQAGGSNVNLAADSGTDTFTVGAGQTLTFSGTDPVQTLATDNDIAISVDNATNTSTGIAKFDSDHFTVGGDGNVRLIAFDSNGENTGSLIPNTDSAYDLGSPTNKWRKLYVSGQTISLGTINLQDSASGFAVKDSAGNPAKISLQGNTTDDLPEGITNVFYSRALFDSALNEGFEDNQILNIGTDNDLQIYHDAGNFRTILNNAGFGDLRIQSNNVRLMGAAGTETLLHGTTGGSVDIYYDASKKLETTNYGVTVTGKLNADSGEITNLEVSSLIGNEASFTTITSESITVSGDSNSVSNLDATNINGNLYVTGNLTIDGTTTTVNSVTVSINDKNLVLADSAADLTSLDGAGITMGGQFITTPPEMKYQTTGNLINFNRSVDVTGAVTADSATFTNITRSGATSYAGTWGSATLIPVVTLDASGFIDSIGTVSVAGVSSTLWDSSTAQLVINTADGGIFRTTINGFGDDQRLYFGDANEASIRHTTGGTTVIEAGATELDLDGAGHFLIKNNVGGAKIAEFTPFAGVDLYYGSAKKLETTLTGITVTGTMNADSATVTNLTADSAVVTDISGTSANYSSVNATTGTISQLDVDSAHIGIIDNNTLNTNALIADSANITNVSGSSANYSTGNFTTLTAAGLTVNGDITGTGNTYIAGNLTVQGTTTTVNSTEVTINDKNIVLADSAVNNVDIDGGGFTLGGALYTGGTKPTITYTLTNDRWALNKALNVSGSITADSATVTNLTADSASITNISGTSANYSTVNATTGTISQLSADSAHIGIIDNNILRSGTGTISQFDADSAHISALNTDTLTRSNTTVTAGTYGSGTSIPVVTVNASGFVDSIGSVIAPAVSSTSWDSSTGQFTINTSDGSSYTTAIKGFGDNQALTFGDDGDLTIKHDADNFRTVINNAGFGDLRIQSNNVRLMGAAGTETLLHGTTAGSVDIYWDNSKKLETTTYGATVTGTLNADSSTVTNLTADSATIATLNSTDFVSTNITRTNTTTVAGTYGTSSTIPVITVNASGFVDSIGTIASDAAGIDSVSWDSATTTYTINFGGTPYNQIINGFSNLQADSASITNVSGTSLNYSTVNATTGTISQLSVDSAHIGIIDNNTLRSGTGTISQFDADSAHIQTLNTHTLTRSNTTVTSGVYGSASLVPIITIDASGFVDSIGAASVAGVSSTSWDSATTAFTVSTADGGSYSTTINGFSNLQADSASITNISGTSANYTTINATSQSIDSAVVTDISGVSLNYGSGHISQFTSDSATITSFQADSATVGEIQFQLGWADSHIGFREGALWYDPHHKNLNYYTDIDHPIELGMQMIERVYNNTGVEIAKGKPLYYAGNYINDSGQESPLVALADATDGAKYNVQGLSAEAIPNASYGQIVVAGVIDDIDTSSLNAGDNFFLGLTPGAIQNAAPAYPNFPMCLGWVIKSDPNNGKVIINQQNHSVPSFRVQANQHISGSLTIDGDLNVTGTQTITSTANLEVGGNLQYLNAGDTIGEAGTTFVGTGLDDAFYSGHYSGDSASKSFFVKIDATGTPDTFEWGFDSAVGTEATGIAITGDAQILDSDYGIEIDFGATTGHTLGDKWTATATKTDIDTGFFSNRNDSAYTHVGLYFDVSENKWTFLNRYDPEPDAPIDPSVPGTQYGVVKATTFEGNLSGNVTGNVTGSLTGNADTATILTTGRDFSLTGDITASAVSFNGSGDVTLTTAYNPGSIVNDDINASAAIVDTKLATISTAGKVQNSATTAVSTNTASAIVTRDASGDFAAGTITADFDRSANTTVIAGTYGSASEVPVFTVDASGFIDSIGVVNVAGVSGTAFDSSTGIFTISTADGSSFNTTLHDSADLESRARYAISVTDNGGDGSLSYDASTGVISYTGPSASEVRAHFSAGTGISISSGEISTNDAQIVHDNLSGFEANEHINHTSVSITAGTGLVGGGDISSTRDLSIDSAEFLAYFESSINHDNLTGFVGNEHIDHTGVSITAGVGLTGGGDISATRDLSIDSAELNAYFGGTGKGFDADTLDGQEGTYYRINVYDAAGSLLN